MADSIPLPISLPQHPPLLVVVSGPSAVGKDAALTRMRELNYPFYFLVTNTTRPKRPEEVEGVDYHFVTREQFQEMEGNGDFLEHAVVYGYDYGNSRRQVREALARGLDVIMRIDVQGAATIKRLVPDAVFIFLLPPTLDKLERRLRKRRTEPEEYLRLRVHAARLEMSEMDKFDYVIVNEDDALDDTADLIYSIIRAEKCRVKPRQIVV
ncbi:MAG: guanylate kinase [Chloroflexi bacterium]|nr:guanylate kinase [Chloroflexota bacterium]MCL5952849.1 guanylate kinase [Chloroflexota bacterium]